MDPNADVAASQPAPQTPTPTPKGGKSTADQLKAAKSKSLILMVFLGLLFLAALFLGYQAALGKTALNKKFDDGVTAGKKDQKAADDQANSAINDNPYRSYTAPDALGKFVISFPRTWSLSLSASENSDPLTALVNPDYVDNNADKQALRITVKNENFNEEKAKLQSQADKDKKKSTKVSDTKVSGIAAFAVSGALSKETPNAAMVLIPVRDKILYLQTDDLEKYGSTFDKILKQAKINP